MTDAKGLPGRGAGSAMGAVQAHAATLLFGVAGLFGKWVAAPSLVVAGLRTLIAGACFAALLAAWPRLGLPPPSGAEAVAGERRSGDGGARWIKGDRSTLLAALAGAILAMHWWLFYEAIQVSTVAVALLAYSTAPGFVALLDPLLRRQRPSATALLGAGLVLAGVAWMVPRWSFGQDTARGAAWGVGAGLLFALLMLLNRRLVPIYGPVRLSFYMNLWASVVLLPLLPVIWVPLSGADWALLVLLGALFTAGAHTLFIGSLQRLNVQTAAFISMLEPVYGILAAVIWLGEVPGLRTLSGGALILGTVAWFTVRAAWPKGRRGVRG